MKQKLLSTMFAVTCISTMSFAQTREVSGLVTAADGTPISGASISIVGSNTATQTDGSGRFKIQATSGSTLNVSYIGYTTQRVSIGNSTNLSIVLQAGDQVLDEVVVTGYGTQRKSEVTGSIASIKGEEFANVSAPSLDKSLQGLAAGVQASTTSGILGQPAKIRIRGVSSISNSSDPLYVVDGVPFISGDQSGVFYNNPLSSINPNDIQSVEVLKDGAATAIYGSRAAGGVILITTKSGQKGKATINYDNWFAIAKASKKYDLLNAAEFIEITNEKLAARNSGPSAFETIDPQNKVSYDVDWQDVVLRTASQQNHALSLSGGTEKTSYFFSGNFTDLNGVSVGNSQKKYGIRGKVEQKALNDKLTIGLNTQVSYVEDRGFNEGVNSLSGNMANALVALPNVPVKWADGSYNISADGSALGSGANTRGIDGNYTNIQFVLDNNVYKTTGLHFNGNAFANVEIIDGLNLRSQIATQYIAGEDFMYWHPDHGDARSVGGRIYQYYIPSFRYNWQNTLNYKVNFGDSRLDVIAGIEHQKTRSRNFFAHGYGLSSTYFAENENIIGGSLTNQLLGGGASERAFSSVFARANYVLLDRYFVSATLRSDKISSLPHGKQSATLPGASIGWDVSKEDFFTSNVVSQFKLRGGYAEVGNTEIGSYPYAGIFSARIYGDAAGLYYSQAGNPDLRFETSQKINIGVDLGFFNDRFTFVADYFRNNINNMILAVPISPSLGVPGNQISQNVGEMYNQGFEFSIGGNIISKENFIWNTNFNATFVKNEILKLVDGNDITYNYHVNREGESIGSFYGYVYRGVNAQNGNAIYEKADGSLVQNVGTGYSVYDSNNPSDISKASSLGSADKKVLGNSMPTWYGGFNNTFSYKGLDLVVNMTYSGGNKVYNQTRQDALNNMEFQNAGKELLDRWTTPGQVTNVPKVVYGYGAAMNLENSANSRFLENGNFLRVKTIGFGYTFKNTPWLNAAYINNLKLFAHVENAAVFTKYSGIDPEVANSFTSNSQSALDNMANPVPRTFTFGINVGF
ncbi:SusC/RagA family TonB-linked outer membrane protein [Sphingobacterium composti]|uniref:SusC/RagA family TonB-linked outer membrane protein n=1 Tax=Sphingobacterium composti TaxID=363260 RepID=UPI00135B762F|nr:TonB-dependent receptor [Sphingobacterium composti Ten et al. 2007 non Yoo et al. 2007]